MSVRDRDNFKKVFGPLIVLTFWFFVTKLPRSFLIFDTLSVKNLPKELDQVEVVNIVQHFVHSINIFLLFEVSICSWFTCSFVLFNISVMCVARLSQITGWQGSWGLTGTQNGGSP